VAVAASDEESTVAAPASETSPRVTNQEGSRSNSQVIDQTETVNESPVIPNGSPDTAREEAEPLAATVAAEQTGTVSNEHAHAQQFARPSNRPVSPIRITSGERNTSVPSSVPENATESQQPRTSSEQPASVVSRGSEQEIERNEHDIQSTTSIPQQPIAQLKNPTAEQAQRPSQTDAIAQVGAGGDDRTREESENRNVEQRLQQVRPRSKRKASPRASASVILAQPTPQPTPFPPAATLLTGTPVPPPTAATGTPSRERASSVRSQASEHAEAFQRIATNLHNGFESLRASQTPSRAPSVTSNAELTTQEAEGPLAGATATTTRARKRRKRNNNASQTIEEQADEVIANATAMEDLAPRRRRGTPESAEEHEIEAETTKLGELCDDYKWGKKSTTEKEMAANWPEILRRRKQENEERLEKAVEGRSRKRKELPNQDTTTVVPQQVIIDGQIQVSNRSVDNREQLVNEANQEDVEVLEVRDIFTRVTQNSIAPKKKLPPGQVWDDVNTELFYQGLRMFGTDFKMISNMIPGKDRRQVKLKYNAEERSNWNRVKRALNGKEDVTLDQYSSMTGLEFPNVEDVYKQMEEEEKRIRAEDEERRRNEGIISQQTNDETANPDGEADTVIPSIEGQDGEQVAQQNGVLAGGDRASTVATTGGRQTVQPPGKKKQTRKTNPNSKRGRQAANKRGGFEGYEERLGGADEVAIPTS